MTDTLEYKKQKLEEIIKDKENDLNLMKKNLSEMNEFKSVKTEDLYNGFIQKNLKIDHRETQFQNNMYGMTLHDTERFYTKYCAIVSHKGYYFSSNQKKIIEEYCNIMFGTQEIIFENDVTF